MTQRLMLFIGLMSVVNGVMAMDNGVLPLRRSNAVLPPDVLPGGAAGAALVRTDAMTFSKQDKGFVDKVIADLEGKESIPFISESDKVRYGWCVLARGGVDELFSAGHPHRSMACDWVAAAKDCSRGRAPVGG